MWAFAEIAGKLVAVATETFVVEELANRKSPGARAIIMRPASFRNRLAFSFFVRLLKSLIEIKNLQNRRFLNVSNKHTPINWV
jgi:hypothetical protein